MATQLTSDNQVLYLYGITESLVRDLPELIGVDRFAAIEAVDCDGVFCWISRVSALEFEKNLASNMENLDWLAETSVAHQRVISAISRLTDILPTRFGTVFRTEDSLCKHIAKRVRRLKQDFARIRGADEWGVKVFTIERAPTVMPPARTGKDYLKAKAALLPSRKTKSVQREDIIKFERALADVATETAPAGNVSRGQRGLAFQTSLLVKRTKRKRFELVLEKFAHEWTRERRIECTGPWPPYSFVSRPDDRVRSK
ncbi:MAG: GvpL/GvpF family gas vesicle protein [Terriglobales bacterium]